MIPYPGSSKVCGYEHWIAPHIGDARAIAVTGQQAPERVLVWNLLEYVPAASSGHQMTPGSARHRR